MAPIDMNSGSSYDLVVIGGGSGGLACAKQAKSYGKNVVVVDFVQPSPRGSTWGLGGTCVNVGCVPKKLMHYAALLGEAVDEARHFGWDLPDRKEVKLDWSKLVQAVQNHVKSVNWVTRVMLREKNIDYVNGFATFIDPHTINAKMKNGSEKIIKGDRVLIAVGGRPNFPDVPGAKELSITSDDLFSLKTPPNKTLIIGAGYIGLECAGFLNGVGFDATVMVRSVVLRGFDQQMATMLSEEMKERGVKFLHKCVPVSFEKLNSGKILATWKSLEDNTVHCGEYDTLLMATGRKPLTYELKADVAGIDLDASTSKIVAKVEQTNVPNVYAVGDVLWGRPELTPVAIQAGRLLADRLFNDSEEPMDYDNVATTVFTPLEYGCVGISEEIALDKFGDENLEVYHAFYKPLEFFVPQKNPARCYLKVICKRYAPRTILGMHYLGPQAGEVIQGYAAAMKCGITFDQLERTVGIHPTTSEEFTRLTVTKRSGVDPTPQSCCS